MIPGETLDALKTQAESLKCETRAEAHRQRRISQIARELINMDGLHPDEADSQAIWFFEIEEAP